ncbi:MAG: biotin/lipoyl-binding protein [Bacteroidales bacterium]|nr:biotin/lipoyl-binding protein [Bacteroidales bacterium]
MKEYKFKIGEKDYTTSVSEIEDNKATVVVNGTSYQVELDAAMQAAQPVEVKPQVVSAATPVAAAQPAAGGPSKPLKSPLPGVVLDIMVNVGDSIATGQKVMLLEAMKMENNIEADFDGVVKEIKVKKGDSVNEGDTLLIIG